MFGCLLCNVITFVYNVNSECKKIFLFYRVDYNLKTEKGFYQKYRFRF